ncbi:MAG: hypothetical protein AAGF92_20810 [Myxococcota bacterium]
MPKSFLRALSVGLLVASLSVGAASCVEDSRFRTGFATFFVEFQDLVRDRFGVLQVAYCADDITFVGDIDTSCIALPMVFSFGQNAFVPCTYIDASGVPWTYVDLFYFYPGYIQEPACSVGYETPDEEPDMDLTRDSVLSRDADGGVLINELEGQEEVELSSDPVSVEELRAASAAETGVTLPATLSSDEVESEPVRTGDTTLGDPPDDVND